MAKAGSTRINFKANKNVTSSNVNNINEASTPESNTETKDSSNQHNNNNANKNKGKKGDLTAAASGEEAFSDHVDGENKKDDDGDDGVSETSDIDVAQGESKRLEKAKSEEGKESAPTAKLLTKASSEERKGSAEGSAKQSKS